MLSELPTFGEPGLGDSWPGNKGVRFEHADLAGAAVLVTIAPGGCDGGLPGARSLETHRPWQGARDSPPRARYGPSEPLLLPRSQESAFQQTWPVGCIPGLVVVSATQTVGASDLTLGGVTSGPGGYI